MSHTEIESESARETPKILWFFVVTMKAVRVNIIKSPLYVVCYWLK